MSEIKHTPTPWVFDPTLPTGIYSDDATGSRIATTGENKLVGSDPKEDKANAAFIVTAANAYDKHRALIETLTNALTLFVRAEKMARDGNPPQDADILIDIGDAALNLSRVEDNACLFAAAPQLLECLKDARNNLHACADIDRAYLDEVIAKAEGRS